MEDRPDEWQAEKGDKIVKRYRFRYNGSMAGVHEEVEDGEYTYHQHLVEEDGKVCRADMTDVKTHLNGTKTTTAYFEDGNELTVYTSELIPLPELNAQERITLLKAMEFVARNINDEEVALSWLMGGVADGDIEYGDVAVQPGDSEKLWSYYEDDEVFAEIMQVFLRMMAIALKYGGLYCNGVVSHSEYDKEDSE